MYFLEQSKSLLIWDRPKQRLKHDFISLYQGIYQNQVEWRRNCQFIAFHRQSSNFQMIVYPFFPSHIRRAFCNLLCEFSYAKIQVSFLKIPKHTQNLETGTLPECQFIITQQMSKTSQYFYVSYDEQEDQKAEIQPLSLPEGNYFRESQELKGENQPQLAEYPFDQEKKAESTFDVTEEVDSRTEVQTQPKLQPQVDLIFQQKTIEKYRQVFRGTKDDTVELNINFKTLLVHYFRELRMLNELSEFEVLRLNEFSERVPSFHSLMVFFARQPQNEGIRQRSLEFLQSKECVRRILTGRCKMKTKLQMIKFIEKVRLNILTTTKGYKWKDVTKRDL